MASETRRGVLRPVWTARAKARAYMYMYVEKPPLSIHAGTGVKSNRASQSALGGLTHVHARKTSILFLYSVIPIAVKT